MTVSTATGWHFIREQKTEGDFSMVSAVYLVTKKGTYYHKSLNGWKYGRRLKICCFELQKLHSEKEESIRVNGLFIYSALSLL